MTLVVVLALAIATLTSSVAGTSGSPVGSSSGDAPVPQGSSGNVEVLGHIGGVFGSVAVQGSYAYVAVGPRLAVFDISDPSRPRLTGQSAPLPNGPGRLVVSGSFVYAAAGAAGFRIFDVSHPARPLEVGSYTDPGASSRSSQYSVGLAVRGEFAYFTGGGGLRIVSIANPERPSEVGFFDNRKADYDVAVAGNYAYIASCTSGLRVIDVADPSAPVEVGSFVTRGCAGGTKILGDLVYLADGYKGLRIIKVSDRSKPVEVGSLDFGGYAFDVVIAGSYAFVRAGVQHIIDIADPVSPKEVGFLNTPGGAWSIALAGKHAYVGDGDQGFRVLDISNLAKPAEVGAYAAMSRANSVRVSGDRAYVAGDKTGLTIVDVSDPNHPTEIGSFETNGPAKAVALAGRYAYTAATADGLYVVDVSDPRRPMQAGFYRTPSALAVDSAGNFAYLASGDALRVLDVSKPEEPYQVSHLDTAGANGVALAGNLALVSNSFVGLRIVDVANPTRPTILGSQQARGGGSAVAASGSHAYLGETFGLSVVDISNPVEPIEVGFLRKPGLIHDMAVAGGYVFAAYGSEGLRIIDVSQPARPVEVGYFDEPSTGVAVVGTKVYIAGGSKGLWILRFAGMSNWEIPNGHFYAQAGSDPESGFGYAVVDDAIALFWREFRRLGGVNAVGYPISRRFMWNGFVSQAFQKAIFQWRPEVEQVSLVNIFDELSERGMDGLLSTYRSTPPSVNFGEDDLSWEQVMESRMQLLDGYPEIREAYLSVGDWLSLNGLPTAPVADYGNVRVLRAQRVAIQQWMVDVPWAAAGQLVYANGGDMAKEMNLLPRASTEAEDPSAYATSGLPSKAGTAGR